MIDIHQLANSPIKQVHLLKLFDNVKEMTFSRNNKVNTTAVAIHTLQLNVFLFHFSLLDDKARPMSLVDASFKQQAVQQFCTLTFSLTTFYHLIAYVTYVCTYALTN